ncbi:nucleotide exchange factor GrpE [Haloplanus sp. C73]|uniref:nucleotide exchange factor GrpE n=1 Tax=Haloplanus sp. C73 TaxID=3421641 RepID=UPI003EC0EF1C
MHEETADGTETDAAGDDADGDETTDLADRVAEYDADLGSAVADLQAQVDTLESELADAEERADDLESKLKRKQADFQNYKKRAKKREEEIKERATEDFVTRLVSVRDDLVRALDQDEDVDIRDGVESTLETFDRVLEDENVTPIEPDAGTEVDPMRHQVMMRVESDQPEGTVVDVYRPGYEMAGAVIQEAQVTVSEGQ